MLFFSCLFPPYSLRLTAASGAKHAALQLIMLDTGDVDVDDVSLLPEDTYKGHGLRKDLVEALAALHPTFMRFPGDCVTLDGDGKLQGQSVVLNVKTRRLYVKMCNAGDKSVKASVDLTRLSPKGQALKTVLKGKPDDENNYEHQPVAPETEKTDAAEKFTLKLSPYSFTMLEYEL